jgi:hypothetical protein
MPLFAAIVYASAMTSDEPMLIELPMSLNAGAFSGSPPRSVTLRPTAGTRRALTIFLACASPAM